jgi:hypothetical protein
LLPLSVGLKVFPNNKGVVSSLLMSANIFSGIMWNFLSTNIINPDNLNPITPQDNELSANITPYFDGFVAMRVPLLFIVITIIDLVLFAFSY